MDNSLHNPYVLCLLLLVCHFIGDFFLQSNWMALGKSKHFLPLASHVLTYGLTFMFAASVYCVLMGIDLIPIWYTDFVALTVIAHFITDAITSRLTSKLWFVKPWVKIRDGVEFHTKGFFVEGGIDETWTTLLRHDYEPDYDGEKRHWFFVVIGFDQLLHAAQLILLFAYMRGDL